MSSGKLWDWCGVDADVSRASTWEHSSADSLILVSERTSATGLEGVCDESYIPSNSSTDGFAVERSDEREELFFDVELTEDASWESDGITVSPHQGQPGHLPEQRLLDIKSTRTGPEAVVGAPASGLATRQQIGGQQYEDIDVGFLDHTPAVISACLPEVSVLSPRSAGDRNGDQGGVFTRPTIDLGLERELQLARSNAFRNQFDPFQRPGRPVPQVYVTVKSGDAVLMRPALAVTALRPSVARNAPFARPRTSKALRSVGFREEATWAGAASGEGTPGVAPSCARASTERARGALAEQGTAASRKAKGKPCLRRPPPGSAAACARAEGTGGRARAEGRTAALIRADYLVRLGLAAAAPRAPISKQCACS
jgi:hypothetical protein